MKVHRFLAAYDRAGDEVIITDPGTVFQIRSVLKLRPGEQVAVGNDEQAFVQIQLMRVDRDTVSGLPLGMETSSEPRVQVVLYCAILKGDHFELVVQKAAEIGVSVIVPLVTQRTVKLQVRYERLEKIAKEAVEVSSRQQLPGILPTMPIREAIAEAQVNQRCNIMWDLTGKPFTKQLLEQTKAIGIFIGPEGGWTEGELQMAHDASFTVASLGKLSLRSETAAIIASFLAVNSIAF